MSDLEKLAGEIEGLAAIPHDVAGANDTLRQVAAALREVSALREALNAVMAEEMIYTGAITETLEASEMYPALVAKIRAALASGQKP